MAYQITLSEDDYAALTAAANETGEPIEQLVHEAIAARYLSPPAAGQIGQYYYPTGEPDSPEDEAEDAYLETKLGSGKPLSEIVLEDRGPR
jgi:hypothetical protein